MSHVLASRYGIPPFFKDKPVANDDMCALFYWSQFQIVHRYATALRQTAFSIYIYTMVMIVITLLLHQMFYLTNANLFHNAMGWKLFWRSTLKIINLCFEKIVMKKEWKLKNVFLL